MNRLAFMMALLIVCSAGVGSVVISEPAASGVYSQAEIVSNTQIISASSDDECNETLNGHAIGSWSVPANSTVKIQTPLALSSGVNEYSVVCLSSGSDSVKFSYEKTLDWFFIGTGLVMIVILAYLFK